MSIAQSCASPRPGTEHRVESNFCQLNSKTISNFIIKCVLLKGQLESRALTCLSVFIQACRIFFFKVAKLSLRALEVNGIFFLLPICLISAFPKISIWPNAKLSVA